MYRWMQLQFLTFIQHFTKDDACDDGATAWLEAAAEFSGAEVTVAWAAGWTGCPLCSLWSLSVAMDSLMSFSCSTDADFGNTRWVSAWKEVQEVTFLHTEAKHEWHGAIWTLAFTYYSSYWLPPQIPSQRDIPPHLWQATAWWKKWDCLCGLICTFPH